MESDTGTLNAWWAWSLIQEFASCGVRLVVFASGYRNAPLVLAADAHPSLNCVSHFDERGAAFYALGWGRATRRPAIWITTSGTAAANGYPAVIEASMDGVPLICLTADRPPELRDAGANQSIDQHQLFGRYPKWFCDLPTPGASFGWSFLRTTVDQACYRAHNGPVHVNCPWRKPLIAPEGGDPERGLQMPATRYTVPARMPVNLDDLVDEMLSVSKGIIIAGRLSTAEEGRAVRQLAESLQWPLLPDILSKVHPGRVVIPNFELCLQRGAPLDEFEPDGVIQVGGPFVSKTLLDLLARTGPKVWAVADPTPARIDPAHSVTHRYEADVVPFCTQLAHHMEAFQGRPEWLRRWQDTSDEIEALMSRELDGIRSQISEPCIARTVLGLLPVGSALVAGSSMPIRDLSLFRGMQQAYVTGNRGASGIDGTVAMAAGFAEGSHRSVTVLLGDLALLHDLNSLSLIRNRPMILVVLNNDGGGIFEFLDIPQPADRIERCFGTPHGLGFEQAARMFGLSHHQPTTRAQFVEAYRAAAAARTPALIEIITDRRENVREHERLYTLVRRNP